MDRWEFATIQLEPKAVETGNRKNPTRGFLQTPHGTGFRRISRLPASKILKIRTYSCAFFPCQTKNPLENPAHVGFEETP